MEEALGKLWVEVLGLGAGQVHRGDNFFALGGDSILLSKLTVQIRSVFARHVSMERVASNLCLQDMAKEIQQSEPSSKVPQIPFARSCRENINLA